jgi:hypothetical protein
MDETANLAGEQGGSGAPVANEAPDVRAESSASQTRNRDQTWNGVETGDQTYAAWTSQLSKEFKGNHEALKALSRFKTVSELAEAFIKNEPPQTKTAGGADFEAALAEAAEKAPAAQAPQAPAWQDAELVKKTTAKLVEEFGTAAAEYYRKALSHNQLGAALDKAGLKAHPDLGRALVLLGREMSEDYTPAGKTTTAGGRPVTLAEGARLY